MYCCLAHSVAFLGGDFKAAEHWADEMLKQNDGFGDEMTEGPHGVQMFMIRRETAALGRFRPFLDGRSRSPDAGSRGSWLFTPSWASNQGSGGRCAI